MNKKELELERQALLAEMAIKIDVIYNLITQATIQKIPGEEVASEGKKRKTTKKAKSVQAK